MKQRKTSQRKCTGCNEMKPKTELVRIVKQKTEQGCEYLLDIAGNMAGRGAYICRNSNCLVKAEKGRGFERSYKASVPREVYVKLMKELTEKSAYTTEVYHG